MTIGENIRIKRQRLNLTQKQLAKKVGVSTASVNYWERGIYYPSVMDLCDLADFFGCTTDELLGRKKCT